MILLQISAKTVAKQGAMAIKTGSTVFLVITVVILLLLAIGGLVGFQQSIKPKRYKKKGIFLYMLCFALLFAVLGLLAVVDKTWPQPLYWGLSVIFLAIGSLHCWMMYLLHSWTEPTSFWPEAFFTLFVGGVGAALFVMIFYALENQGYPLVYDLVLAGFFIPFLVTKAFDYWFGVPQRQFVGWKYTKAIIPNTGFYNADRLQHYILVNLVISEETADNSYPKKILVKVSPQYKFGEFFQVWVHERNSNANMNRIEFLEFDPGGHEVSWIFYVKPKSWWQFKRYLNPKLTFEENRVKEADTIVVLRVSGETFTSRDIRSMQQYESQASQGTQTTTSRAKPINLGGNRSTPKTGSGSSGIKIRKRD